MFDNVLKKWGVMSPEWVAQHPDEKPSEPIVDTPIVDTPPVVKKTVQKTPVQKTITVSFDDDTSSDEPEITTSVTSSTSSRSDDEMKQKIRNFLHKINKEGIDFMELWEGTEEMDGGITPSNIKNAFAALRIASGGKLTKDYVIETAQYYKEQIQLGLTTDVSKKKEEKLKLVNKQKEEKQTLQNSVDELAKQIEELTKQKETADNLLSKIDSKYKPTIQKIDEGITSGSSAVQYFTSEIQNYVDSFLKVIK